MNRLTGKVAVIIGAALGIGCATAMGMADESFGAIRTVQKHGGLDRFLVDMDAAKLGPVGQRLKRRVHKAMGGVPAQR